jgi:hypothetical protein
MAANRSITFGMIPSNRRLSTPNFGSKRSCRHVLLNESRLADNLEKRTAVKGKATRSGTLWRDRYGPRWSAGVGVAGHKLAACCDAEILLNHRAG